MKKKGKFRLTASAAGNAVAVGMAFVLALSVLTGCRAEKYEHIELDSRLMAAGEGGSARPNDVPEEIHVGDDGSGMWEEAPIVIGQEGYGLPDPENTGEEGVVTGLENVQGEDGRRTGGSGKVILLFGGDVLLSSHVLSAYQKAGGIHGVLDEGYLSAIRDADFFMVNEEFPFSSRGVQAQDKQYTFRLEPERVSVFREMGIDAVTLANNHALDFGVDALLDTCAVLDGAGIMRTGAGADLAEAKKPVEMELGGRRIAVIGATRVIPESGWAAGKNHPGMLSSYDATALLAEIRAQKQDGKIVIVYVHWGVEKDEKPQEYQRTLGQQYIDAGADLVVGAHPHVLQGIEYYKGKPIVYSLGNFVFGSSIPRTMLLEVGVNGMTPGQEGTGGGEPLGQEAAGGEELPGQEAHGTGEPPGQDSQMTLRVIPGTSGAGYTRVLTDAGKIQEFYRYMESISFGASIQADGTVEPAGN